MAFEENSMRVNEGEVPPGSPPLPPDRSPNPNSNPNPNPNIKGGGLKGKSCKGCMYYSSIQKSKSKYPTCVGISRTLHQVPGYIVGETELEAAKEGRVFADFRYACVGYSVFLEKNGESADPKSKPAELPFCVGLEILMDKRTTPAEQVPAHAQKQEDGHAIPQRRTYKPATATSSSPTEDYLNRFKRNAGLVASGVARNMNKVGNYIKESVDDILYPYRRRPK